jgi:hypothetical protein
MILGLGFVALRAVAGGDFRAALIIVRLVALLAWQMLPLVARNRPRQYDPTNIPAEVMPEG